LTQVPVVQVWLAVQVCVAWPQVPQHEGVPPLTHVRVPPGVHWHAPQAPLLEQVLASPVTQPLVEVVPGTHAPPLAPFAMTAQM
jgi:hypothetical protein